MRQALHGGDVRGIARLHQRSIDDYIDFSANINPLGPPEDVRALLRAYAAGDFLTRYPEPGLPDLTAVLAAARGVEPSAVVIHGGSAALFDAIIRACAPRRLGVCLPAFAEYARAAAANALEPRTFTLDPHSDTPLDTDHFCRWVRAAAIDAVILTNPHNPLGFAQTGTAMRQLIAMLPATTFIIDEAFADYDEAVSVARDAAVNPQLVVVRSVTKFYAMPDLRVGYAIMTPQRAQAVGTYIPAWPVSGIAAAAAAVAVGDAEFATRSRASNALERERLAAGLATLGLRVLPATANFLTVAAPHVGALRERLIVEFGLIVRDCSSFAGLPADEYLRVAVRNAADNATLLDALAHVLDR